MSGGSGGGWVADNVYHFPGLFNLNYQQQKFPLAGELPAKNMNHGLALRSGIGDRQVGLARLA